MLLSVAGGATYIAVIAVTDSAKQVVVPQLHEKDLVYVLEALTGLGLNLRLKGSEYSSSVPRNHVLTQEPDPGTVMKIGRNIMIRISKGKKEIPMPDLRQISFQEANLILENSWLKIGTITKTYFPGSSQGKIISQEPPPERMISRESAVDLLISRGEPVTGFVMPNLYGLSLETSGLLLRQSNIGIGRVTSQMLITAAGNTIIKQSPAPGAWAPGGSLSDVVVNKTDENYGFSFTGFNGVMPVNLRLEPGFLKKRVKIEAELFGQSIILFENLSKPGKTITVLIPGSTPSKIRIWVDDQLVKTETITPWKENT